MTRLILCTLLMVILMILISCTGTGEGAMSTLKILKNGKQVSEKIKVDVKRNLVMYIVREPASSKKPTLVVMYDINKGLRMIIVPGSKCYLRAFTPGVNRPAALQKYLKQGKGNSKIKVSGKTKEVWKNVVNLTRHERSNLSKEMAGLCEKLQIVRLSTGEPNNSKRLNDPVLQPEEIQMRETSSKRQLKRSCSVIEKEKCWMEPEIRCPWWKCRIVKYHRICTSESTTVCN